MRAARSSAPTSRKLAAAKRERFPTPGELFDTLALRDRVRRARPRACRRTPTCGTISTRGRDAAQQMREQSREARVAGDSRGGVDPARDPAHSAPTV
jgi:hypothetical protein